MAHLIYAQDTGKLYNSVSPSNQPIGEGYAGAGEHRNNPESQCISNLGPIPRGWYSVGELEDIDGMPAFLRLTPDSSNDMCDRSGFLIHGDSATRPGWASEGCIIMPRSVRELIAESDVDRIQVLRSYS